MEGDKKKKNKKKKGKQTKTSEDVALTVGQTASLEKNHVDASEQNHRLQISGNAEDQIAGVLQSDVKFNRDRTNSAKGISGNAEDQIAGVLQSDVKLDRDRANAAKGDILIDVEEQRSLQREVILEGEIKQLRIERDCSIQREAGLEKEIIHRQNEKNTWFQMQASMEEKIDQLVDEKTSWIVKWASLEDTIKQLEIDKESWAQKENSIKETITRLNEDNMHAQAQVKELQDSRDSILQENERLMENISILKSEVQKLEKGSSFSALSTAGVVQYVSKDEDLDSQMEAAHTLLEKLITENAELVEKVNELNIELSRQSVIVGHSSTAGLEQMVITSETSTVGDSMSEFSEKTLESGERMESSASIQNEDQRVIVDHSDVLARVQMENSPGSCEAGVTEEIVQIPLDENEIQEIELQGEETDGNAARVPLSDAPLTGAPFRLISFVAKYVSGADLVGNKASNAGG